MKRANQIKFPGLWIAFYGPDGAGKSAIAARIADELSACFSGVQLHHLRIPLWRGPRQVAIVTQPHAQPSRGVILSCLKLVYMFAQSWIAHLLRTRFSLASGRLVILDRYYLDYMVDPKRYRLAGESVRLASLLGRFTPKPNLQFVLDVPAEELQRRKPEVSVGESRRQRQEYAATIAVLPNATVVDSDRPLAEVAADITREIIRFQQCRSRAVAEADLAHV